MIQERTTLNDPVLRLWEYWFRTHLMHEHVHHLRDTFDHDLNEIVQAGLWHEFETYLSFWLSSLFVVAEGYLELKLNDPKLDRLLKKHFESLKLHRNGTYHFQRDARKQVEMVGKLNWAEKLHVEFRRYLKRHIKQAGPYITSISSERNIAQKTL